MNIFALLLAALLAGILPALAQTNSLPTPVPNLKLTRGDANGSGFNFTNLGTVRATTFIGNGSQLSGISSGVSSVNGQTGAVVIAIPSVPVLSVNGQTGAVSLSEWSFQNGSNTAWQFSGTNATLQLIGTLPSGLIPSLPYDATGTAAGQMQNLSNTVFSFGFITGTQGSNVFDLKGSAATVQSNVTAAGYLTAGSITNLATIPQLTAVSNAIPNVSAFITGAGASNSFDSIGAAATIGSNVAAAGYLTAASNINATTLGSQGIGYFAQSNWTVSAIELATNGVFQSATNWVNAQLYVKAADISAATNLVVAWADGKFVASIAGGYAALASPNTFAATNTFSGLDLSTNYSYEVVTTNWVERNATVSATNGVATIARGAGAGFTGLTGDIKVGSGLGFITSVASVTDDDALEMADVFTGATDQYSLYIVNDVTTNVVTVTRRISFGDLTEQTTAFSNTAAQIGALLTSNSVATALGQSPLYTFAVTSNDVTAAIGTPMYPSAFTSNSIVGLIGQPFYSSGLTSNAITSALGQSPIYVVPQSGFTNYGCNIIPLNGATITLDFAVAETNYAFSVALTNVQTTIALTNLPATARRIDLIINATGSTNGTLVIPSQLKFEGSATPLTNYYAGSNYTFSASVVSSNYGTCIFSPHQP